jgi:hypothetical protein
MIVRSLSFLFLACTALGPIYTIASSPASYNVTPEQISTYQRDGVIIVRGLLEGIELKEAIKAATRVQRSKSLGQRLLYKLSPSYRNLEFQTWRKHRALEKVAFDSAAPTICAKLMGLENTNDGEGSGATAGHFRPLRLLKDAVLGYSPGDKGCGWHVDDRVFWPCEDRNIGKRDAGVNVWITLSPVSAMEGGGLAVAPGSHRVDFAKKAREAIAAMGPASTCLLQKLAPDCHERMEKLKMVHDLEAGDAIIHDRYVFHRAEPFVDPIKSKTAGTKQRVSLRYVPADATFFDNKMNVDRVIKQKGLSTGDPVSKAGEYFPQTWPNRLPEEKRRKAMIDQNPFTLKKIFKMVLAQKKEQKNNKA